MEFLMPLNIKTSSYGNLNVFQNLYKLFIKLEFQCCIVTVHIISSQISGIHIFIDNT